MLPVLDGRNAVRIDLDHLLSILEEEAPTVELYPASGLSLTEDHWVARLPQLALESVDHGIDAALIGLAQQAADFVEERLRNREHDSESLPMLLRLFLAKETGNLRILLESRAELYGWDFPEP